MKEEEEAAEAAPPAPEDPRAPRDRLRVCREERIGIAIDATEVEDEEGVAATDDVGVVGMYGVGSVWVRGKRGKKKSSR